MTECPPTIGEKQKAGLPSQRFRQGRRYPPTHTLSHSLPVNDSLVLREAEYSGSGVSFLRLGSYTSNLNKTKAQLVEAIHSFPVFVKSCSNPYWISEFMAQDSHFLERRQGQRCMRLHQVVLTAELQASCSRSPLELAKDQWAHRLGIFGRKDTLRCLSAGASDVCWSLTPGGLKAEGEAGSHHRILHNYGRSSYLLNLGRRRSPWVSSAFRSCYSDTSEYHAAKPITRL